MKKNIISLYPGKFKPFTGGHYSIVRRYLDSPDIAKFIIVISRKDKDGFKAEDSKDFITSIFKSEIKSGRLEVNIADTASPVGWCYDYVNDLVKNSESDSDLFQVHLVSSTKGGDDSRMDYFEKSYIEGGKYADPKILIVDPKIKIDPLYDKNGAVISATNARESVLNNEFQSFKDNYPQPEFTSNILKSYFDKLRTQTLNEGGAAGHMSHIVDVNEFDFSDYKTIINRILDNKFDMTEKVDGLNCFISYRSEDKQFVIARNKKHLRGEPLTIQELPTSFSTPEIGNVYYVACLELSSILKDLKHDTLSRLFTDGSTWMNFEIIDSKYANIISYGKSLIVIHNFQTYTNDEQELSDVNDYNLKFITKFIESKDLTKKHFKITGPVNVKIDTAKLENSILDKKREFLNVLNDIMSKHRLSESTTMAEFFAHRIEQYLDKHNVKLESHVLNTLIKRWVYSDKSTRLNVLMKDIENPDYQAFIKNLDTNIAKFEAFVKKPIHNLFISVGDYLLNTVFNLVNDDKDSLDKNSTRISGRLESVKKNMMQDDLDKYSNYFDNIKSINPSEGITFNYKGHLLKLTGSFYYINKVFHLNSDGIFSSTEKDK